MKKETKEQFYRMVRLSDMWSPLGDEELAGIWTFIDQKLEQSYLIGREQAYLQGVRDMWLGTKTSIGSQTIYLRSKFSRDNSRGETEEEKNTEMIVRKQTMEILDSKAQQFIDSLEKGENNE